MNSLRRAALAAAVALGLVAPSASAQTFDDTAYFAAADKLQQSLDPLWNERRGHYEGGGGGVEPMINSLLLLGHSVAAMEGHTGPSRNDERARALALELVKGPYVTKPALGQAHAPGWTNSMTGKGFQHLVFDAEVVDGLVYAYRARQELQLPESTVAAIRDAISRTARGPFWRYPTIRLNQINWYGLMYAADATVTGDPALLKRDFGAQLNRFIRGARSNFGPGMRFHYLPHEHVNHPMNVDSAEYANIVLSFTRFYNQARQAGMAPLNSTQKRIVSEWIERAIAGYWTHGGYMNWDSGLGFQRWHQSKKLGLTQQALIGIASAPTLSDPKYQRYAKHMFDRSLDFYARTAERDGGIADALFFNVHAVPQGVGSARLGAARVLANAARAIDAGLGRARATEPPALYAYDPDIGRLAVTTPSYNTAIVAVNQRAFPYGGLDLARLFDGSQEVAGNIGGTPPASFGALVRDVSGRRVLASQVARSSVDRAKTPLVLTKAPSGAGARASSAVGSAYAGAFTDLRATGTVSGSAGSVRVTHRFTPRHIQTRWDITRRGNRALSADILFPSTGRGRQASVTAVLKDGSRVTVGSTRIALARVSRLEVKSQFSGYTVTPLSRPAGAGVHLMRPAAQSSAPEAGPTLAVQIARNERFSKVAFTARITPDRG
ncbi:hypothetical protein DVA67_010820 [Solirubrobacter sp. CPCC 204708]|uniref:D-glucuronyl C5-epimerase C-terminal domain-containing protein n=1 Tax=Solirubrobacter deserti TaxID=2282478 RepID=A0ABT4RUM3_9ACTN|nr:hypothetical protein [Solirubrobacter deserti]MBE2316470.1 hypothetical protein [Solirubrobacter deserti]MDA0142160.1 hypothetical protein [Solirubrobacter deserti]